MIHAEDRLSSVLAKGARLLDVLTEASPSLASLRDESLRKNMAARVTVEQAAKIAGLDVAVLVDRLNRALAELPQLPLAPGVQPSPTTPIPPALAATPPHLLVDVDVREDLRAGLEPFARIMGAVKAVTPEQVLRIRAIFEPAPLYGVLAKRGLVHFTERISDDDWRVWFYRAEGAGAPVAGPDTATTAEADDVVVLDVRGLEPPDPMIRTFEALAELPRGKTLLQINVRVPQFLLPKLDEQGFVYEIREQSAELVRVFIRHKPN